MSETRTVEFRDAEVTSEYGFRGYAAVFDSPWNEYLTDELGYVETVARGAFRKALKSPEDIPLLWAHDRKELLATRAGGNLEVREDGRGLLVEANLPENGIGAYVREMIARGDVRGMSYGMATTPADSVITRDAGVWRRSIANVRRILDVTLTWEPAYLATTAELRGNGFTALSLQELTEGAGGAAPESGDEGEPPVTVTRVTGFGRMAGLRIDELVKGGYPE